jgi:hypothetical protein
MHVHKFIGRIFYVFRLAIGDISFEAANLMPDAQNFWWWILLILIIVVTSIIFLNFIIAEVSNSYQEVKDQIPYKLLQECGGMINEAEDMLKARYGKKRISKWKYMFPKFIIKRELD